MIFNVKLNLLLLTCLLFISGHSDSKESLFLADTSSPKATLDSFYNASDTVIEHWLNETLSSPLAQHALEQATRTMDLSLVPNRSRVVVLMERILLLREVLDRLDPESLLEAPEQSSLGEANLWRISNTDLLIVMIESGEKHGQYLFSAGSIQQLPTLYKRIALFPYALKTRPDHYQDFKLSPGPLFARDIIFLLPEELHATYGSLPLWQWLAMVVVFILCKLCIRAVMRFGRRWNERKGIENHLWQVGRLVSLLLSGLIVFIARYIIDNGIWVTGGVYQLLSTLFLIWQFLLLSAFIMALFNYAARSYAYNRHGEEHVDSSLITVLARIVGGLIIVMLAIYVIEFMGVSISPILAGLGVGGLAVALAIRPVLENVINGLTLYADGGIKIGELCKYGGNLGTIESIGLRSTRIRTLERSLITIPNSEFANMEVDNLERRDKRRMEHKLQIRSELSTDQLKLLLVNIRRALLQHPKIEEDPIRARFVGVGEYAVIISLMAYISCRDNEEFLAIQEDVLFLVMQQVNAVGAQLAFSNQYQFAGKLAAIDQNLIDKASQTINSWHEANNYPFPNFSFEYQYEIKNSMVYPAQTASVRLNSSG